MKAKWIHLSMGAYARGPMWTLIGVFDAMPWLRGIPLEQEKSIPGQLANVNIRKDRTDLLEPGTDHFNIEKKAKIHQEVIAQVLAVCPPRLWLCAPGSTRRPSARAGPSRYGASFADGGCWPR